MPIVYLRPGGYEPASGYRDARLRTDLLLSYFPNPGTVIYLGYGATRQEPLERTAARTLTRTQDGFFLKLSWLFRMNG